MACQLSRDHNVPVRAAPPQKVTSGTVRIRRWPSADAEVLHELVLTNIEHLRSWMPWVAAEPVSLEERQSKITEWCTEWDAGGDFMYAIVDDATASYSVRAASIAA